MKFYTTKEQEKLICKDYNLALKKKQKEIDEKEKKTGKLHKYSASFYIRQPSRVFICEDEKIYMVFGRKKIMCPIEEVEDGGAYFIDPTFEEKFNNFVSANPNYSIKFTMDNGSVGYCGGENVYSSTISSLANPDISEEYRDEEKMDLVCG